jgi:hypothetical protein
MPKGLVDHFALRRVDEGRDCHPRNQLKVLDQGTVSS